MKKRIKIYAITLLFMQISLFSHVLFLNAAFGINVKPEHFSVSDLEYKMAASEAKSSEAVFLAFENSQQIVNEEYEHNEYTPEDFLHRFKFYLIILTVLLAVLIFLVVYTYRLKRAHYKAIMSNELKLRSITNNINGGVLVLLPKSGYRIIYVNDGYLKMLQYSREDYDGLIRKDYISFVHPGDRRELNKILKLEKNENENNFSAQLRIMRKDGKYVPTIFSGTLVEHDGENELYCIVMDISRENSILERLEFEQERYKTLIEKSDEIIYEVNFLEQSISVSKKFKEKFGWTLPEKYWGQKIPDLLHIYEEDRPEFGEMLKAINEDIIDGECIVRVYDNHFYPLWCKILFHVIKKDGVRTWLIGKLTDIDEEIKEKQDLLYKAETDALTGLYNKEAFRAHCEEFLASNANVNCALIFFDIDNFKEINDNFGHAAGDKVLRDISLILKENFTDDEILGRFGGDEFCIFVENISKDTLNDKLNKFVKNLGDEYISDQGVVYVSASIGAACSADLGNDFGMLLESADKALYYAKENGKDGHVIYFDGLSLKGYTGKYSI